MGPGVSSGAQLVTMMPPPLPDSINGVTGVVVEQDASETVKAGTVSLDGISITGASPDFKTVRAITVATGRFFTDEDVANKKKVIVLGSKLADELFGTRIPPGRACW